MTAAADAALLEIRGLRLRYAGADADALHSISLQVARGEAVAIVGESGSGKSTLVNAILGMHAPGRHAIGAEAMRFDGQPLPARGDSAWRRLRGKRIGYVAQDASGSLNPLRRAGWQLAETLRLHHPHLSAREIDAQVQERLQQVGFKDPARVARSWPHELSGGMNQRVAIALALAGDPDLLLADEPTSALDVSMQAQVLDSLQAAARARGLALLFITHDLGLAADRADRILVMQQGHIVEEGPTRALLATPAHPYTRALLTAAALLEQPLHETPEPKISAQALMEVRGLRKSFGRYSAFNDVNFHLDAGETLCIVGESGSGKTSLVRAILQLSPADEGSVRFADLKIGTLKGADLLRYRREAQMVYQNPFASLNSRHSIAAILTEPLRIHGIGTRTEQREAAAAMLRRVGLPAEFLDRWPGQLSGGQRQRVAIARALITNPRLVVLDESVSALDVAVQQTILDLLLDLQREFGLAYLFITHDLAVARRMGRRVLVMNRGEVVEQGPSDQVLVAPQHPYTRALLAAAPGSRTRATTEPEIA